MNISATPRRPAPRASILSIAPYVPGHAKPGADQAAPRFRLASNETPLGPSPAALAAFRACAGSLEHYPDGAATDLRAAIGEVYGLNPAHLFVGNGSDELLSLLSSAYLNPGDEAIYSQHGFLWYPIVTHAAGGVPIAAPERDLTADVDAILAAVTERTRIVFIANPNNPTGTYLPFSEIRRLHSGLPEHVLLVIDAAYAEYVRRNDYESGVELVSNAQNVVMLRTFSKIHGLAALRLGWMYAPEHVVDVLNRIRGPFNANAAALAAGAAAIRDRPFIEAAINHNQVWLPWLTDEISGLGLRVVPSVGNFIMIDFSAYPGRSAADANLFLMREGIVLRPLAAYGLPDALRMTVGSEEANQTTVEALGRFLNGTHA